ncbi:hypothetical protein BGZ97_007041 [Linnemannia gamsii]|uniref:WD40 repeat-like protein n=1 Tax=Linnemannia gamsii TaxID=64522 RepID=A0A9P6UFF9_9FUNG|nr:hypothetical protein BGZ97_007041 [Linnemannia gamsii]
MGLNQYARVANDLFQEAVIAPFTKKQIEDYIDRYIPLEPRGWEQKDYMDKMEAIPNLMDLVKNPFLLTLCLEALPNVVEGKTDLSRLRVTRVQLYDTFVQHWLGVNKRRLQEQMQMLSSDSQLAFEALVEDGFESNGITFQQDLAGAIFQEQDGKPIVVYTQRRDGSSWKASFFGSDPEISLLRTACLLSRVGARHRFVHRSILEYFYSCTIISGSTDSNEEFAPHSPSDASSIDDHPLSQRNLVVEPSIIQFLAERVQLESFKQQLLAFIEKSKTDERAARAAANAITILVAAGVHFNGADLRGIRIPKANLSDGQFASAQLQEADLTEVNLTRSCIRQADLSQARMEGVQFGELPFLEENVVVGSIAYSSDGKSFAVGLESGHIEVYDTATWTWTRTLFGHRKQVKGVAYSPSGEHLLSGVDDKTVRLWNSQTGSIDSILKGHTASVNAVAFSPSGDQIASASYDRTVRLWDSRTGAMLFVLQGHTDWSATAKAVKNWKGHETDAVYAVDFSPNSQWIASSSDDCTVKLWDAHSGTLLSSFLGHALPAERVMFSPDGMYLASGSGDKAVRLWSITTAGAELDLGGSQSDPITSVAYSPDGTSLISGNEAGTVRQYDAVTGQPVLVFPWGDKNANSVAFSPDGLRVATVGSDKNVRIWNAKTGVVDFILRGHTDSVDTLAFSPDGRWIASGSHDKSVHLWDAHSEKPGIVLGTHSNSVITVAFSPCGQQVVSGSYDGTVRVWERSTGEPRVAMDTGTHFVTFATGYSLGVMQFALVRLRFTSNRLELWDEKNVEALHTLDHEEDVEHVAFSPCGQWIAVGCNNSLWVWNLVSVDNFPTWRCNLIIGDILGVVTSIAWRPNVLEFVTGTNAGCVQVWKLVDEADGRFSVRLLWSAGRTKFVATDAVLAGAVGLSATNQRLLKQRGALDE